MTLRPYAAIVATLALAAPLSAGEPAADGQRVRMEAIGAKQAVEEFARICLIAFPDLTRTHRVIQRSQFGYVAATGTTDEQWRSGRAVVGLDKGKNDLVERCNFDAMLKDAVSPKDLTHMVGDRLADMLNAKPLGRTNGTSVEYEWADEYGKRVLTIDFSGAARQLSVSVAGWQEGAA